MKLPKDPRTKRNQVGKEKGLKKKKKKKCFEEEIVDAPFESNINTFVEENLNRNCTC